MHLERVRDASGMRTRYIRASAKPPNKAASKLNITATPFFARHVPGTHAECVQDTCERYLGAELYCTIIRCIVTNNMISQGKAAFYTLYGLPTLPLGPLVTSLMSACKLLIGLYP